MYTRNVFIIGFKSLVDFFSCCDLGFELNASVTKLLRCPKKICKTVHLVVPYLVLKSNNIVPLRYNQCWSNYK